MASISQAGPGGFNNTKLDMSLIGSMVVTGATSSVITWSDGGLNGVLLFGTGLQPVVQNDQLVNLTAGTMTQLQVIDGSTTLAELNLTVSAVRFYDLMTAQQWGALAKLMVSGNDQIMGTGLNDRIIGGKGSDLLTTFAGNDVVKGGGGADTLIGGQGDDTLYGGKGADTFVFDNAPADGGVDTVKGFVHGTDHIELAGALFGNIGFFGAMDPSHFHLGTTATAAAQGILYDKVTGDLWADADGNGPDVPVLFAHLDPGTTLSASDFSII